MMNFVFAGLYALIDNYDYNMMKGYRICWYKMLHIVNNNGKGKEVEEEKNGSMNSFELVLGFSFIEKPFEKPCACAFPLALYEVRPTTIFLKKTTLFFP